LAAEDNLQVVYPTTPAQYFHVLRRQVVRPWRKPLIVLTPKSLLRNPRVVSSLDALAEARFQRIIPDRETSGHGIRRVLLCSGKIFYDLEQFREEKGRKDVAILRVEQLYPLQRKALDTALTAYRDDTPVFWVQEEPENMGAWRHMHMTYGDPLLGRFPFKVVARPVSATPATGSHASHDREQAQILERAFNQKV
ncbi:MAG TPA: hypothetical protein VK530_17360, partial [Candidatus Acidoferrum sp.]|nr:hypothetical protein [Candidatus Acidoferrum sp.]